jgi:RNase P/RNase MRP subunit p30
MIPQGGVFTILDATKNLFTGLKPIIFLLVGVMVAFIVIEFLVDLVFKRANEEGDIKHEETRISERIIGSKVLNDIKEMLFLSKKLGFQLPAGWQNKIKTKIYEERFEELTEKYGITPIIDITPRQNVLQRIVKKFKRSK